MEIQNYIDQRKKLLEQLIAFVDNENDHFYDQIKFFQNENNNQNKNLFLSLLQFISNVSKNHRRNNVFYSKIEEFFLYFKDKIKQTFSNLEIFKIFQDDNRILFFLFEQKMITLNEDIKPYLFNENGQKIIQKVLYLYPVIKNMMNEYQRKKIESEISKIYTENSQDFIEKCKEGENDSFICSLIRKDSVDEFVIFVTKRNISLFQKVRYSIFETNLYLIENEPSLIEYAAFYGSIQIFQYLRMNDVDLTSSLWLYAIHGRNPDLIHLLEELQVEPNDSTYEGCLKESVKCYHNEIANYIQNNLLNRKVDKKQLFLNDIIDYQFYKGNIISYAFQFHNYSYIPHNLENKFYLFYLCEFNYLDLVKLLLKAKKLNINVKIIL